MKNLNLPLLKSPQKLLAFLITSLALLIASQATYFCIAGFFNEPDMPESLIKKD
jgi:cyclic lactone autoinducer peptide